MAIPTSIQDEPAAPVLRADGSYLMTRLRSGLRGEAWVNGRGSTGERREARTCLLRWIDRTTRQGQAATRTRAQVVIDPLLAGFACWEGGESGDWRMHSPHRATGAVLKVAPRGQHVSFEVFKQDVRGLSLTGTLTPIPHVPFTSPGEIGWNSPLGNGPSSTERGVIASTGRCWKNRSFSSRMGRKALF